MNITLLNDSIEEILNSDIAIDAKIIISGEPNKIKNIRVIPHKQIVEESIYDIDRVAYTYWIDAAKYDVKGLKQNDKVIIDDITYNVEVIQTKISGWATIYLSKYDA